MLSFFFKLRNLIVISLNPYSIIENVGGQLTLHVNNLEAETFVNGQIIFGAVPLKHCDRLVIGGSQYFRVSNPYDPDFCDTKPHARDLADFEVAHQEIMKTQEMCLRKELQREKEKAIAELEAQKLLAEKRHQEEVEQLGSCLKIAEKRRDELESQVQMTKTNSDSFRNIIPYKSTFLEDLAKILGEEASQKHSLHEMHLLVSITCLYIYL